jgi:transformer-2 protein
VRLVLVFCLEHGANDGGSVNPGNNLHVSGLSHKIDTRDLEAAFAKIGRVRRSSLGLAGVKRADDSAAQVQKASVMYDPHTRESRGFGFVTVRPIHPSPTSIPDCGTFHRWRRLRRRMRRWRR